MKDYKLQNILQTKIPLKIHSFTACATLTHSKLITKLKKKNMSCLTCARIVCIIKDVVRAGGWGKFQSLCLTLIHHYMNNSKRLLSQLFFFFKFLLDTCPFLGPLIPLFRTSGDVSSGFQSRSEFYLIQTLWRHMWYTFPEIHLWCDTYASVYSQHSSRSLSPHVCFSRGRMSDLNHRPPAWEADMLTTWPQWPGLFICKAFLKILVIFFFIRMKLLT